MELLEGVTHLNHASIKIQKNHVFYIDPFRLSNETHDADFVFCTHDHFDHLSKDDIKKVLKAETVLVVPKKKAKKFKKYPVKEVIGVEPDQQYEAAGISFRTVPAYNLDKKFHKKKENWVGYIITIDSHDFYFAGDTDYIPEMDSIKTDVAFIPVSGKYVCTAMEAAQAVNSFKPKVAVPIHFGAIVGDRNDAETFINALDASIQGVILMKE
jgi:L-ascorbate metabolism protein UlaG (beta-lactamase superfamily)